MTVTSEESQGTQLRGRTNELRLIAEQVAGLSSGRGSVLLINGEAGLGKSELLRATVSTARKSGLRVFYGGCAVAAQSLPLAPLLDALINSSEVGIDPAVLRELGTTVDQRYWLLRALEEQLEQAALQEPVLVALDDIQWADAATLSAISILPRRMMSHPILWALAVRSGDLSQAAHLALSRLRRDGADEIPVTRLDDKAVTEVSLDILLGEPDHRLRAVLDRVGGQPLWLVELLTGLRDEHLVAVEAGVARLVGEGIPRRLLESVADQLARLSAGSREGLQIACVLGRSFSLDELASLMDRSAATLIDSVREALGAGLIVDLGDRLSFRHDLVREAIEADLPPAVRRSLRRRALDVLLEHGAPAGDVAGLVMEVARPGDDHAIAVLERAIAEIGRVSPSVAAPLSRRLLELIPDNDPTWSSRVAETVHLLVHSGQAREAQRLIDQSAGRMTDHAAEAGARMTVGSLQLQYGPADCAEQCRLGLELPGLPLPLRIALLSLRACALEMLGAVELAADSADQATAEALAAEEGFQPIANLPARALVAFDLGDWRTALDLAAQGVKQRDLAEVPAPRAWLFDAWQALIHIAVGQLSEALELISVGIADAERYGISANLRVWSMLRCRTMLALGRLPDAAADAEAVMEMSDEIGQGARGYINNVASYVLSAVALHTGDVQGLAAGRKAAAEMRTVPEGRASELAAWMTVRLDAASGDLASLEHVEVADLDPLTHGVPLVSGPRRYTDQPELVRVLLAAHRDADALAVADRLASAAYSQPDFPFLRAAAVQARALVDDDFSTADEAVRLFERCREPLLKAAALEDAGRLRPPQLGREAADFLDQALEIYDSAGAARDAARVRGLLRRRGVRRPDGRSKSSSRWPELSESELAVVRLVATGATNRQVGEQLFLSPHTVNAHLRHIFGKLGIRSRVELARITAERERDQKIRE
jgi:DNA-binding CsgD family transcriptional regulator/tetratricopeptide (TPR) repeat protein